MEPIGNRIQRIRKEADLSMDAFGKRIGVGKSAVSMAESGKSNLSDSALKLICREFRVNYLWLTEGEGEIYSDVGTTILEMLSDEYQLDDQDKAIMEMYLALTDDQRAGIKAFVNGMVESDRKKQGG